MFTQKLVKLLKMNKNRQIQDILQWEGVDKKTNTQEKRNTIQ